MICKKKTRETIDDIGTRWHNFDFMAFNFEVDISYNILISIVESIIYATVFVGVPVFIIVFTMAPMFRDDSDETMLKDYKEIIDELILKKESENYGLYDIQDGL